MANGENQLTIAKNNKGQLMVNNPNVELSNLYVTFKHQKDSAGDKQRLDSLDQLFMQHANATTNARCNV